MREELLRWQTRYFYTEYSNDEWYEGSQLFISFLDLNNFVIVHRFEWTFSSGIKRTDSRSYCNPLAFVLVG